MTIKVGNKVIFDQYSDPVWSEEYGGKVATVVSFDEDDIGIEFEDGQVLYPAIKECKPYKGEIANELS